MPSTTSSSICSEEPSSTVMTPSLPTLPMASAILLPMFSSALAEMVPTWAMDLSSLQGLERVFNSSTTAATALSMPRFKSIGFMPAATALTPSVTMDCASTVAVVVPSPASSEVLDATSFTICAPMFSNLSFSSISLATETPSLVTVGAPKLFSSTALRPFGPRVALTAFASTLTPRNMRERASSLNLTSLAAIVLAPRLLALNHGHDVLFTHHQQLLAVDLDFSAAVLAEKDLVSDFDVESTDLAVFENLAVADRDDLSLDRLLSRRVGNDDAAGGGTLLFQALDDDAVMKRTNLHGGRSSGCWLWKIRAGGISTLLTWLLMIGQKARISSPAGRIFVRQEDYDRSEPVAALRHALMAPLPGPLVILTPCPDEATASRIARDLVESGLAACVSRLGPVHSTYRWQGALQDEPEVLLVIKTVSARYPELEMRLKSLHPYEVPEIIALPVAAIAAGYLSWLEGAVV